METRDNTPLLSQEWNAICSWLDASPVPTLIASQSRVVYANEAAAAFVSVQAHDLIDRNATDFVVPVQRARFEQFLSNIAGASSANFDLLRADGSAKSVNVRAWPVACDHPAALQLTFDDAADNRQAHADAIIRSDTAILEQVLQGTPLPQVLNALLCETEAQSDKGMLCSVLLADETGTHLLHAAAPNLPDTYSKAIHGLSIGERVGSCGTAAFRRERVIVTDIASDPLWADFKELAQRHSLAACVSTPMISSDGVLLGTVAMYYRRPGSASLHDLELIDRTTRLAAIVVERKRSEDALRETKRRLDLTLAGTDVGTWVLELASNTVTADENLARMFHVRERDRADAPLKLYLDSVHEHDRPVVEAAIARALQTESGNYEVDYRVVHPDAPVRWVTARGRLERDEHGRALRFAGIALDITDRKLAEVHAREI
ncbi:MAG TPA: PAS domain-containing protein, partial [Terriglobales bacterium]